MEQNAIFINSGIRNIGNTCYLNTALQCLYHISPFRQCILNTTYSCEKQPTLYQLKLLFTTMMNQNHTVIIPVQFVKTLIPQISYMNLLEQNDASEFISIFIDIIAKETKTNIAREMVNKLRDLKYEDTPYHKQKKKMDVTWCQKIGIEYSPFVHMFAGQHISQILCNSCGKIWHNYELYQDISLPIPINAHTLYDCFDTYFEDITLEDWKCDACEQGHNSTKTILLWRTPRILMVILKRFEWCNRSESFNKNTKNINIPLHLDISKYNIGPHKISYSLRAIAQHNGSYLGGHYNSICKNENEWIVFDDDTVFKSNNIVNNINGNDYILSSGYIFFYESF